MAHRSTKTASAGRRVNGDGRPTVRSTFRQSRTPSRGPSCRRRYDGFSMPFRPRDVSLQARPHSQSWPTDWDRDQASPIGLCNLNETRAHPTRVQHLTSVRHSTRTCGGDESSPRQAALSRWAGSGFRRSSSCAAARRPSRRSPCILGRDRAASERVGGPLGRFGSPSHLDSPDTRMRGSTRWHGCFHQEVRTPPRPRPTTFRHAAE